MKKEQISITLGDRFLCLTVTAKNRYILNNNELDVSRHPKLVPRGYVIIVCSIYIPAVKARSFIYLICS